MANLPDPFGLLTHRQTLAWLIIPVLFLPVAMAVLFLFGQVFSLLGDVISSSALNWAALTLGILWCLALISTLLCTVCRLLQEQHTE